MNRSCGLKSRSGFNSKAMPCFLRKMGQWASKKGFAIRQT
jgi:hypothetical protein